MTDVVQNIAVTFLAGSISDLILNLNFLSVLCVRFALVLSVTILNVVLDLNSLVSCATW